MSERLAIWLTAALLGLCIVLAVLLSVYLEYEGISKNSVLIDQQTYSMEDMPLSLAVVGLSFIAIAFVLVFLLAAKTIKEDDPSRTLLKYRDWSVQGPLAVAVLIPVIVLGGFWIFVQRENNHKEFQAFVEHVERITPVLHGQRVLASLMSSRVRVKLDCIDATYKETSNLRVKVEGGNVQNESQVYDRNTGVRFLYDHPLILQVFEDEGGGRTRTFLTATLQYDKSDQRQGDPSGLLWLVEIDVNPEFGSLCQTGTQTPEVSAAAVNAAEGCEVRVIEGREVTLCGPNGTSF